PTAVRGFVDAAIGARTKERSGRRDVDRVRVTRIEHDARNRLRLAETDVRERLAAIGGLVHPVAKRCRLPVVRLTGADVDDVRIVLIDGDIADGGGPELLEDGHEARPRVCRLEHSADGVPDPDDTRVLLVYRDVVDASAHARRSD